MKALKKLLAVLSAGTMIIGGAAMSSMTASADASWASPQQHVALYVWTNLLEENGIPFSSMGSGSSSTLEKMLKEKGISAADFCNSSLPGADKLTKEMKLLGCDEEEINLHFIMHMVGMQMAVKDPFGTKHNAIFWVPDDCVWKDEIPDNSENIKKMIEQGYTWNPNFGWEFDVEKYLQAHYNLGGGADVLSKEEIPGDVNGDGVVNITDVVYLQKALSISEATLDMDVNGDGKVNVFDVVALKRMLTEELDDVESV